MILSPVVEVLLASIFSSVKPAFLHLVN
jgi:hypothetical protein